MKFGGELRRDGVSGGAFGNARGSITVLGGVCNHCGDANGSTALEDFLAGDPFKASVQVGDPTRQIHDWAYGLFFQDDWRVRKNLTLNYGVRYEFSSVIKEAHNRLGNFDPTSPTGLIQVGINHVSSPYNSDPKDFGPRFGFAWDVNGKGQYGVRGGAGLMYEDGQLGIVPGLQQQLSDLPTFPRERLSPTRVCPISKPREARSQLAIWQFLLPFRSGTAVLRFMEISAPALLTAILGPQGHARS